MGIGGARAVTRLKAEFALSTTAPLSIRSALHPSHTQSWEIDRQTPQTAGEPAEGFDSGGGSSSTARRCRPAGIGASG
jgi:hypothetical protein